MARRRPVIGITFMSESRARPEKEAFYLDGLRAAGGEPLPLRPGAEEEGVPELLRRLDGLLLAGGDDVAPELYGEEPHPKLATVDGPRDRLELLLVRAAAAEDRPVLGICRGIQVMNVALGGSLVQDIADQVPGAVDHVQGARHAVRVERGSRLYEILGAETLEVTSFHHQAVKRPAAGLRVTARSPDGVIEAVERSGARFLLGVQWHPERLPAGEPAGGGMLRALVTASGG